MPASDENRSVVSAAMDDTNADAARMSRCSIILVHGTFGRGSEWFQDGSPFRARLNTALKTASLDWPVPVRPFLWSGDNSVHARDDAARRLSDQLRKDLEDDPDATAVIIAHSHGGNVALRALQLLDAMSGRVRVVTLATPFLRVFVRQSFELPTLVSILLYAAPAAILLGFAFTSMHLIWGPSRDDPWLLPVVIGVLIAIGVATFFIWHWLIATFINREAALAIAEAAHYDPVASRSRVLVIRGVDDEASLFLAAGSIGSRLSYLLLVGVIPAAFAVNLASTT